jgi:tRNA pseudouridine38-40 synthase
MRYFLEVSYKGTNYSGFQSQINANTIQAEIEKAFQVLLKRKIVLTGSSRTDAGVHALQNYFHFDVETGLSSQMLYKLNAVLPSDIAAKDIVPVKDDAHCRFDAISREYKYFIYKRKDPFQIDRAFYFPYTLDLEVMKKAADLITEYSDFTSFSKRNTQAKTFECNIKESKWTIEGDCLVYHVVSNRFLRGMVRALTATMLKLGRGKMSFDTFKNIIEARDCTLANFAVPAQGLYLIHVAYPQNYFK